MEELIYIIWHIWEHVPCYNLEGHSVTWRLYFVASQRNYLHYETASVVQQATVLDKRRDVNNDQLFGAYLGLIQNQLAADIAKRQGDLLLEVHIGNLGPRKTPLESAESHGECMI